MISYYMQQCMYTGAQVTLRLPNTNVNSRDYVPACCREYERARRIASSRSRSLATIKIPRAAFTSFLYYALQIPIVRIPSRVKRASRKRRPIAFLFSAVPRKTVRTRTRAREAVARRESEWNWQIDDRPPRSRFTATIAPQRRRRDCVMGAAVRVVHTGESGEVTLLSFTDTFKAGGIRLTTAGGRARP